MEQIGNKSGNGGSNEGGEPDEVVVIDDDVR